MSQLIISRLLKPTVCKHVLRHKNVRLFSTPAYPYLLIDFILNTAADQYSSEGRFRCVSAGSTSHLREQEILIKDKELVEEVRHAMACASYDSGVRFHMSKQTFLSIHYQDPSDPKSKPVIVDLPPLPKGSQIQSLDMSSRPDLNNKDWVVAVKYSGSQLRLYRPACHDDSQWIDIKTTPASINPFSSLMYSKKDKRFYIPTPGGEYWCSLHLHFKKGNHPKFNTTWNVNIPRSLMHEYLHELDSFLRTDHLVESPSGEKFLVKWYSGDSFKNINGVMTFEHITKRFMVFRTDDPKKEFKVLSYTDNIGDLCIFLGHGEALCVPASSSPGLKPNCIYFVGYTFGVYDIATRLCTTFITNEGVLKSTEFPYWPSPIPLYS